MLSKSIVAISLLASITPFAAPAAFSGERLEFENDTIALELETIEFQQIDSELQNAIREADRSLPGVVENKSSGEKIGAVCEETSESGDCKSYSFYLWSFPGSAPVKLNKTPLTPEQLISLFKKSPVEFKKIPSFFSVTKRFYSMKRQARWDNTGKHKRATDFLNIAVPIGGGLVGIGGIIALCTTDVALTAAATASLTAVGLSFTGAGVLIVTSPIIADLVKAPFMYSYVLIDKIVRQGKVNKKAKIVGKLVRTLVNESGRPFEKVSDKQFSTLVSVLKAN